MQFAEISHIEIANRKFMHLLILVLTVAGSPSQIDSWNIEQWDLVLKSAPSVKPGKFGKKRFLEVILQVFI